MPFRFYRRVKIAPGLTLNLSKGGLSLSGGVPGAKVTVGKTGIRQTLGLTGTGLHWTKHRGWGNSGSSADRVHVALSALSLDELRQILRKSDVVYANPSTNRRYTENQILKEIEKREEGDRRSSNETVVANAEAEYRAVIDHWKALPTIPTLPEFQEYSDTVSFKDPPLPEAPNFEAKKRELARDLTQEIYKRFPYTLMPVSLSKRKAAEELNARWPEQARRIQNSYEALLQDHLAKVHTLRTRHEAEETRRVTPLLKILEDDPQATTDLASTVFENIDWPFETAATIATNDGTQLFINLDLPEIEDVIPDRILKIGRGGNLIESRRTKAEQNEDYFDVVVGQAVYLSACQFAWNPTIRTISIAAYTQRANSRIDEATDQYVYSVKFSQHHIRRFDPKRRSLLSFLTEVGAEISINQNASLRKIAPPDWVRDLF